MIMSLRDLAVGFNADSCSAAASSLPALQDKKLLMMRSASRTISLFVPKLSFLFVLSRRINIACSMLSDFISLIITTCLLFLNII